MNEILVSVLSVSGISGALALLLSIANKTIGNYGEMVLTINEEKQYTVEGGSSLLSTLVDEEIFIPSACGGKGSCGYCKVTILEGGGQFLPTEMGYVTPEEQQKGIRLACQCKVKENIKIQIPEELFNVRQYDYKVTMLKSVTPTIKHVKLELPQEQEINFKAGQYIQILSPIYKESDEEVYRAYSIASCPADPHCIELFVGLIPEGKCSTFVHHYLKEGDKLTVVGPFGEFYYHESDREMLMVAIATGMAPIMAILRHMAEIRSQRKATFFFGARTGEDLFMMDELHELEKQLPNFKFVPSLSRPRPEDNWTGEKGRVTDLIEHYLKEASNLEAYLCGSPIMIDGVVSQLREKGVPDEHIYYDKFE
jgi:Na+-transporting NADH:ubiquinone oxidoreductase subunit F